MPVVGRHVMMCVCGCVAWLWCCTHEGEEYASSSPLFLLPPLCLSLCTHVVCVHVCLCVRVCVFGDVWVYVHPSFLFCCNARVGRWRLTMPLAHDLPAFLRLSSLRPRASFSLPHLSAFSTLLSSFLGWHCGRLSRLSPLPFACVLHPCAAVAACIRATHFLTRAHRRRGGEREGTGEGAPAIFVISATAGGG